MDVVTREDGREDGMRGCVTELPTDRSRVKKWLDHCRSEPLVAQGLTGVNKRAALWVRTPLTLSLTLSNPPLDPCQF
jgi:hypothetical protein